MMGYKIRALDIGVIIKLATLFALFTLLHFTISGQGTQKPIVFDQHLTQLDNPILSITQDESHFIWFGTKNGLLKFDGKTVRSYPIQDGDSVNTNLYWVWDILVDGNKNLLVGSTHGLRKWNTRSLSFEPIELMREGSSGSISVRKIFEDGSGHLWVGTNRGLYKSPVHNYHFEKIDLSYNLSRSADFDIREIVTFSNEKILIASQYGISTIEVATGKEHEIDLYDFQNDEIRAVYVNEKEGTIWIGTQSDERGVIIIDLKSGKTTELNMPGLPESNSVRVMRNFGNDDVWLGTMSGLFRVNKETREITTYLRHKSIRDIFYDKDKSIWVGTFNDGVYYHNSTGYQFNHIEVSEKLNSIENKRIANITDIVSINENQIWIGTDYGVKLFDHNSNAFIKNLSRSNDRRVINDRIKCLRYSKNGTLWVGTFNGLMTINNDEIKNYLPGKEHEGQSQNGVNDIGFIGNEVWIGTNGNGLFYQNKNGQFQQIIDETNRKANYIKSLLIQSDSIIWVGSNAGLYAINAQKKKYLRFKDSKYLFENFNILSITEDIHGNLCLGTERQGVIYFDPIKHNYKHITKKNGLPSDNIKSIILDKSQNLWVSTENELSKVSFTSQSDVIKDFGTEIFNFDVSTENGKASFSYGTAEKLKNGDLLFGTQNGIISFSPQDITTTTKHPKVWIWEISINQENISTNPHFFERFGNPEELKTLELASNESTLTFYLTGINYSKQNDLYFAYQLEGLNPDWQILDKQDYLRFSYLPPGTYNLNIKSSNVKQKWGSTYSTLNLIIHPPFYKSPTAFIVYSAVILALLYLFYHYTSKWQKMKNQLVIEELNKNKEHELHQLKSEFFVNISHELKTPLTLILSPIEELLAQKIENIGISNRLKLVKRNAEKISGLVNKIVEVRKIENSVSLLKVSPHDIVSFTKDVASRFNELSRIKDIDFNLTTPESTVNVWFDPDGFDTVISNLLSNAFKYTSDHGKIYVTILANDGNETKSNGEVIILIEDNGKGISQEDIPYLFDRFHHLSGKNKRLSLGDGIGLDLSKKIIDLHKGSIKVESIMASDETEGRTRITISLQKGKGHFDASNIVQSENSSSPEREVQNDPFLKTYNLINSGNDESSFIDHDYALLIVESDKETIRLLKDQFTDQYNVYVVSDGLEAWKLVLDIIPDIVITIEESETISGSELCHRIKIDERTCHIPIIKLEDPENLKDLGEFIADEYLKKPFDPTYLKQRVDYLIRQRERVKKQFQKKSILKPEHISSYDEKLLNKVIQYLEDNLASSDLTVEKLRKEVGVSRVHFYRKIKSLMNLSPNEFIRTFRIRKAGQLLEQKKINISDVRMMVGFNDPDYFRSCFKKEFGRTPSDFVNEIPDLR